MKKIIYFFLLLSAFTYAQTASDILRISQTRPFGTARSSGLANAMGSIGGDMNSFTINPAGLGLFRKSEFSISYHLEAVNVNYSLAGNSANRITSQSVIPNGFSGIGLVITSKPIASNWKNFNFGLTLSRTADFKQSIYFSGKSKGSIVGRFLELALDPNQEGNIGLDPDLLDNFEAGLAYETGAIYDPNPNDNKTTYVNDLLNFPDQEINKKQVGKLRGSAHDFTIGFAGNWNEKIAVGGSLVIPFSEFYYTKEYEENEIPDDEITDFVSLKFRDSLSSTTTGLQAKIGFIYKPIKMLRLGLSFQSPTLHWVKDRFTTDLTYSYFTGLNDTTFIALSPEGSFNYKIITPLKLVGSIGLIGKYGFLSADVDFIDYKQAKFNLTDKSTNSNDAEYQESLNKDIDKQYRTSMQYRIGGELALSFFRIRAGLHSSQSPYSNSNLYTNSYHFGLGLRGNKMYVDLAYTFSKKSEAYIPYQTGNSDINNDGKIDALSQLVNQDFRNHFFQVSLGFKF